MINNRISEFEQGFKQIVGDTISYFDVASKKNIDTMTPSHRIYNSIESEQFFHVYTLGLLAILSDDFIIKSNKESGEGRYDIMLIPYDKTQNGIVIEIKHIEKQKENEQNNSFTTRINNEIKTALAQIDRNKYYKELLDNKIKLENIIKVPIVFAGKEPFVSLIEKWKKYAFSNPTSGKFKLQIYNDYSGDIILKIRDYAGKELVFKKYFKKDELFITDINLSSFEKGVYLIECIFGEVSKLQKVVVE